VHDGVVILGLPDATRGCLFDLDGVLTQTATVHAKAWQQTFDAVLHTYAERTGTPFVPFDIDDDYAEYVDGKPREDGVRDFLAARGIHPPEGHRDDGPDADTIYGIGTRKNNLVQELIRRDGVEVYDGSRVYLERARAAGLRRAVVSSSANTAMVLQVTGLAELVEERVDGVTLAQRHLAGKPAPDSFQAGAALLGLAPGECVVFEDALSGVQAGHAAGSYTVGVDRIRDGEHGPALTAHGADVVVADLADLLTGGAQS
jgi:beta-phosphoglucomutase family hydrolase